MKIKTALIGFFCLLVAGTASAQQRYMEEITPNAKQEQILKQLETYLNGFNTMSAGFYQSATKGQDMKGKLYIQRPGKMRFQYDEPAPFELLANGSHIVFYEPKREQVTYIPTDKTPAALILRNKVSFKDPALSILKIEQDNYTSEVTLTQKKDPLGGILKLVFTNKPMALKRWEIVDASGIVTTVSLDNIRYDAKLDRNLFIFNDPRESRMPGDLTRR